MSAPRWSPAPRLRRHPGLPGADPRRPSWPSAPARAHPHAQRRAGGDRPRPDPARAPPHGRDDRSRRQAPEARELILAATREPLPVLSDGAPHLGDALEHRGGHRDRLARRRGLVAPPRRSPWCSGPISAARSTRSSPLTRAIGRSACRSAISSTGCRLRLAARSRRRSRLSGTRPCRIPAARGWLSLALQRGAGPLFILPLPCWPAAREGAARPAAAGRSGRAALSRPGSLATPAVALANARARPLRMADVVEEMLKGSRELLGATTAGLPSSLRKRTTCSTACTPPSSASWASLARLSLSEAERARLSHILTAALNLEHAGDIIDKGLLDLAAKRIRRRPLHRAGAGRAEAMHEHLLAQLRLAVAVFMAEDLRRRCGWSRRRSASASWSGRPPSASCAPAGGRDRAGASEQPAPGLVRDLKRVEAHLAAIAHPLLERSNLLGPPSAEGDSWLPYTARSLPSSSCLQHVGGCLPPDARLSLPATGACLALPTWQADSEGSR